MPQFLPCESFQAVTQGRSTWVEPRRCLSLGDEAESSGRENWLELVEQSTREGKLGKGRTLHGGKGPSMSIQQNIDKFTSVNSCEAGRKKIHLKILERTVTGALTRLKMIIVTTTNYK